MAAHEPVSDATVQSAMETWGMPPDMLAEARMWYANLQQNSYFSKAFMVPWSMPGATPQEQIPGMLVAVSTPESTRAFKASVSQNQEGARIVDDPEWLYFQVYWYPRLSMLNFKGLTDHAYPPTSMQQPLGEILAGMCRVKGIENWKNKYCIMDHGLYHESLRRLLRDLGIHNWLEITTDISWQGYRALDAYLKVFSGGMAPPAEEAHFLLNVASGPKCREHLQPEDWYMCREWRSVGQKESISEHALVDVRARTAMVLSGLARNCPQASARVARILGHIEVGAKGMKGVGEGKSRF